MLVASESEQPGARRAGRRTVLRAVLKWDLLSLIAIFVVLQLLPYGRSHTNPGRHKEPAWDSARTRDLVVGVCYDCHSNRTAWPWYSYIAPAS